MIGKHEIRVLATFVVIAMLAWITSTANAALLAEEAFNYSPGSLVGQGPGTGGFGSNTWSTVAGETAAVTAGSISPSRSGVYTSGNKGEFSGTNSDRDRALINLDTGATGVFGDYSLLDGSGNVGADGTTLFISFLLYTNEVKDHIGLDFYRDGARAWFLGQTGSTAHVGTAGTGTAVTEDAAYGTVGKYQDHLYVLQIDFGAAGDTITGWFDPTAGAAAPTAAFSSVAVTDYSFDAVTLWNNAAGTHYIRYDEIRIGTSFADVTSDVAVDVVPEPASMTLLCLGAAGMLIRRRRS